MALSTRRGRSPRLLVAGLVVLSLLTITADYRGGPSGPLEVAGRVTLSVVGPMQQAVTAVFRPVGSFFSGLAHVGTLQAQNEALRAQVRRLQLQSGSVSMLTRENASLQQILKLQQSLHLQGQAASVIGQSVSNFEWSVTIGIGSSSGVAVNDAVVSGGGLVGHVVQTSPHWSSVQLILDPRSAVASRLSSTGDTGLVVGGADQDPQMQLVSSTATVTQGQEVVTAGYQGGLYPSGIVVGFVARTVRANPSDLSLTVPIRPAVDFSSLQYVFVVTGKA